VPKPREEDQDQDLRDLTKDQQKPIPAEGDSSSNQNMRLRNLLHNFIVQAIQRISEPSIASLDQNKPRPNQNQDPQNIQSSSLGFEHQWQVVFNSKSRSCGCGVMVFI
jgi:hypothetical protein